MTYVGYSIIIRPKKEMERAQVYTDRVNVQCFTSNKSLHEGAHSSETTFHLHFEKYMEFTSDVIRVDGERERDRERAEKVGYVRLRDWRKCVMRITNNREVITR